MELPADTRTPPGSLWKQGNTDGCPLVFSWLWQLPRVRFHWKQGPGFWVASLSTSSMCTKNLSDCQEHEQGKKSLQAISKALSLSYQMLQLRFPNRPSLLSSSPGTSPQNPAMLKTSVQQVSPVKGSLGSVKDHGLSSRTKQRPRSILQHGHSGNVTVLLAGDTRSLLAGDTRSLPPGTPCTSMCSSCTSAEGLMRAKNKALLKSSHFWNSR